MDSRGWVHWIEVPRQRGYEPLRHHGRVWIRRERSSVEPSPTELQDLYNAFGFVLTEERGIQAASPADIDLQAFRSYLHALGLETDQEPQPRTEDDLRNRGVLTEIDGAARHAPRDAGVQRDRRRAAARRGRQVRQGHAPTPSRPGTVRVRPAAGW